MTRVPDEDLLEAAIGRLEDASLERILSLAPEALASELAEQGVPAGSGHAIAKRALTGERPPQATEAPDEDLLEGALGRLEAENLDRLNELGPEALAAELAKQGLAEAAGSAIADRALRGVPHLVPAPVAPSKETAKVVPLAPRRNVSYWASLLVAASVGALFVSQGPAVVAWMSKDRDIGVAGARDVDENYWAAQKLWTGAKDDYQEGKYAECLRKLHEAKRLEPEWEATERFQQLRRDAEKALAGEGGPRESPAE